MIPSNFRGGPPRSTLAYCTLIRDFITSADPLNTNRFDPNAIFNHCLYSQGPPGSLDAEVEAHKFSQALAWLHSCDYVRVQWTDFTRTWNSNYLTEFGYPDRVWPTPTTKYPTTR